MGFRFLRSILLGVFLWILIFIEVSVLVFWFGLEQGGDVYFILHIILLILFTLLTIFWYFRKKKTRGGFFHGLLVGIIFIIVIIILDSIITIPLFIHDYSFLSRFDILVGELVILIVSALVGLGKGIGRRR
ncbi:MAG: hypothetical protein ABIH37_03425 [archaeon]